jgi:hypothetical protein
MATMIERLQSALDNPTLGRRRFITRAMKASATLTAVAAGVSVTTTVASAQNGTFQVQCCNLAFANHCNAGCPCNSTFWSWSCSSAAGCSTWECGECWDCQCSIIRKICNCC